LVRQKLRLEQVPGFISQGARRGVNGSLYPYQIGLEHGSLEGVEYFLAKGLDQSTSRWLDDRQIYDGELTYQKMSLFARAMRDYVDFVGKNSGKSPYVIHANDWNVIPAAVAAKQAFKERMTSVPLVFTVHLLGYKSFDWHFISQDWCGIRDETQNLGLEGMRRFATCREVWDDLSGGKIERFGGFEADFVATVSESYLSTDVLPFLGQALSNKAGFIYNACDWDEERIARRALKEHGQALEDFGRNKQPKRSDLRKYLLTKAIGLAGTPDIPEPEVRDLVNRLSESAGSAKPGAAQPFQEDGGLVLFTGRLDRQKGVDVLLRAVPEVLEVIPSTKFLLQMIPLPQRDMIDLATLKAAEYKENVRIFLGRVPAIYQLSYISADVYAMPSRWEPFGLTALEAMATGNPVVGTRTGGITETVLDVLDHPQDGTGTLVNADDHRALADGLVSFLTVMKIEEESRKGQMAEKDRLLDLIPFDGLRNLVAGDPYRGSIIRDSCRKRVKEHFGLENAARMAVRAYERASSISQGRSAPA
ncbi:MAG: glycosyltransferase, partial [Thaumarchaeota archaeon]|nr:glycosyltransferase [Nitrososphaerota archaeon]